MLNREELNADRPCQTINGKKIPCVVVQSHQECILDRDNWKQVAQLAEYLCDKEIAKVERLEKDITFYATASNWVGESVDVGSCGVPIPLSSECEKDRGTIAKQALAELEL